MKKLSFLLLAFGLFLGSCSKQSYVSCPSFKDGHKSLAWNNYQSTPKKKKSKNLSSQLVKKSTSDWAVEKEIFSVEPIAAKQNAEPLYASVEPSVLYTPNLNLLNEKPVAPASHKAAKKPIRETRIAGKTQADQQVLTQSKKETEKSPAEAPSGGKSQLIALLLCFFLGGLGIHRFYLGYTTIGIIQLLTAGGCGIWALIDLIRIITGDLKPKDGDYTEKL
ncbi:MAG: TM2 domain-containing protein [Saprospiraceae bacterium]|nr:TM2 domain-containing protein [Candidatus Vicinibacter affinis]MBK9963151.1 TM2 domain-containing protein [Candidatus Vicinibacter affinis]